MNFIYAMPDALKNDLQTVNSGIREWYNNVVAPKTTSSTSSGTTVSDSEYSAYLKY